MNRSAPWSHLAAFFVLMTVGAIGAITSLDDGWFIVMGAALVPLIVLLFKKDPRANSRRLIYAYAEGRLKEAIGPRADQLNAGAIDLEQINTSLRKYDLDGLDREAVIKLAEDRLRRALELTIGAPAAYSLTIQGAERQIDADLAWLREVREHCERLLVARQEPEESDHHLRELRELISAREDAIDELELRS